MKRKKILAPRRASHRNGYHRPKRQLAEARQAAQTGTLDERGSFYKRFSRLYDDYVQHLGGEDNVSIVAKSLAFDAALCGALIQQDIDKLCAGGHVPREDVLPVVNTRRRLLRDIGIDPRTKDVTPDLSAYLAD